MSKSLVRFLSAELSSHESAIPLNTFSLTLGESVKLFSFFSFLFFRCNCFLYYFYLYHFYLFSLQLDEHLRRRFDHITFALFQKVKHSMVDVFNHYPIETIMIIGLRSNEFYNSSRDVRVTLVVVYLLQL